MSKPASALSDALACSKGTVAEESRAVYVGGVRFDLINRSEALETMTSFVTKGGPHLVCASNVDCVVTCQTDSAYREIINQSALSIADGMGIVFASRMMGCPLPENVCGRLILTGFCRIAAQRGYRVFLLGGGSGIPEKAAKALANMFPSLQIVGTFAPPVGFELNSAADEECVRYVRAAAPQALFVALGAPKQEKWLSHNLTRMNVPVSMGVGYSFDLLAGRFPVPPKWMTSVGMEWAFRLYHEPQRLAKRYLWRDLKFLRMLPFEIWRQRYRARKAVETR